MPSIVVLFILGLGLGFVLREDEQAALERYRIATQAKEEALVALEAAYAKVESAWLDWRQAEGTRQPPLADDLAVRVADLARSAAERRAAAGGKESRGARRAEVEELARAIAAALEERGLADATLRNACAATLARDVAGRANPDEVKARLVPLLDPWLGPKQQFAMLWNDALHLQADEAKVFADRYAEYISAGVELDRVRHPETYLPGGAKTRPGMVYVPGGSYTVGPNHGFERRKRKATLRPFLIDRCEVSNADYLTFIESLPPEQRVLHTPRHWPIGADGRARPPPDRLDHPVTHVTWRDADAYARFVGKRIPTEDEWEVAARGRDGLAWPWGPDHEEGRCNDASANRQTTAPVTAFAEGASPFKAINMAGNVEEWTASLEEGEAITELGSNIAAVIVRGGHYLSPPENVQGAFRWVAPGGSSREPYLGFRCAADLK